MARRCVPQCGELGLADAGELVQAPCIKHVHSQLRLTAAILGCGGQAIIHSVTQLPHIEARRRSVCGLELLSDQTTLASPIATAPPGIRQQTNNINRVSRD